MSKDNNLKIVNKSLFYEQNKGESIITHPYYFPLSIFIYCIILLLYPNLLPKRMPIHNLVFYSDN